MLHHGRRVNDLGNRWRRIGRIHSRQRCRQPPSAPEATQDPAHQRSTHRRRDRARSTLHRSLNDRLALIAAGAFRRRPAAIALLRIVAEAGQLLLDEVHKVIDKMTLAF